jgi:hypothetical protein
MNSRSILNIIHVALSMEYETAGSFPTMKMFAEQFELDMKQTFAFEGICSSFLLSYLHDNIDDNYELYQSELRQRGGRDQLLMFLTGPGGSGKSFVIFCSHLYCKQFCNTIGEPFYNSVFAKTAVTTITPLLFQREGTQYNELHSKLMWLNTKILIVEGISTAKQNFLVKLDTTLRQLKCKPAQIYGGINIVFVGDFLQLPPSLGQPIYHDSGDIHWHGSINACVMLDQGIHRFKKDPEWGEMLSRIYCGNMTEDDIRKINTRIIGQAQLPENVDCMETRVAYACLTNTSRNQVIKECFYRYVKDHSPAYNCDKEPSDSVVLIKGLVSTKGNLVGCEFHQMLWAVADDHNVIGFKNIKVDPCLKLFYGCPLVISCNTGEGRNILFKGTTVNFVGVHWKEGFHPQVENYKGYKVMTGTAGDVASVMVQFQSGVIKEVHTEKVAITIKFQGNPEKLRGFEITQFPVNIALATTVRFMEGLTKDIMIVVDQVKTLHWWMYFVLSRVNSLNGLFLFQPIDRNMLMPLSMSIERELMWLRMLENDYITMIRNLE